MGDLGLDPELVNIGVWEQEPEYRLVNAGQLLRVKGTS